MKRVIVIVFIFLSFTLQAKSNQIIVSDTTEVVNEHMVYKVFHDAKNIHISISTSDKNAKMELLRRGVTVYFDIKGKKKKNVYVKYPKEIGKPDRNKGEPKAGNRPGLKEMIEEMPKYALYKNFDIENQFHIGLNALDIALSFSEVGREILEYKLRISKSNINSNSKKDFSKLLVGVVIGGDKKDNKRGGGNSGISMGQQRGSGGGRRGGGGGGQGGPPSGGGRQGGSGKSLHGSGQKMTSKTFWFKSSNKK